MLKIVKIVLFFVLQAGFTVGAASGQTEAENLVGLEQESPQRAQWILEQNHQLNLTLKKSPSLASIQKWAWRLNDQPIELKSMALGGGQRLILLDQGLAKPQILQLQDPTGQVTQLFSSFSIARNQQIQFLDFSLSPDGIHLVMIAAEKGSIDGYRIYPFDRGTRKIVQMDLFAQTKDIHWSSQSEFIFNKKLDKDQDAQVASFSFVGGLNLVSKKGWLDAGSTPWSVLFLSQPNGEWLIKGEDHQIDTSNQSVEILAELAGWLYLKAKKEGQKFSRIVRVSAEAKNLNGAQPLILEKDDEVQDDVWVLPSMIVQQKHWGLKEWLSLSDLNGQFIKNINLPNCCTLLKVAMGDQQSLQLTFTGPFIRRKVVELLGPDYKLDIAEVNRDFLMSAQLNLSVSDENFSSFDGTKVPARLLFRSDLKKTGLVPVWISSYGGFNVGGETSMVFDPQMLEFLNRGGVFVGAGLRGGNEYGSDWHKAGAQENKRKTFEDLAAIAASLVDQGWTQPDLIISKGESNGGLTVAAAACLYPQHFGLVVPTNGVLDLVRKEAMDRDFSGWSYEYGDSSVPEDLARLIGLSPVELGSNVKNQGPKFLILNGRLDTRVNPAHSLKLKATLDKYQSSGVRLSSINNSGHWFESPLYQDVIGWRTKVILWTTVFDHLGWQMSTPSESLAK